MGSGDERKITQMFYMIGCFLGLIVFLFGVLCSTYLTNHIDKDFQYFKTKKAQWFGIGIND